MASQQAKESRRDESCSEIRRPEPYFVVFVFIAAIIGGIYFYTAATQRVDLEIPQMISALVKEVCEPQMRRAGLPSCAAAAQASAAGRGTGSRGEPMGDILIHTVLLSTAVNGSGSSTGSAALSGFSAAVRNALNENVMSKIKAAFGRSATGQKRDVEHVTHTRDGWELDTKTAKLLASLVTTDEHGNGNTRPQSGDGGGNLAKRCSRVLHQLSSRVPLPLNSFATLGTTIVKMTVAVAPSPALETVPDGEPKFVVECSRDPDDVLRGGCLVLAAPSLLSASATQGRGEAGPISRVSLGFASVIAKIVGTNSFKSGDVAHWAAQQDALACCSAHDSLTTLQQLLDAVAGMPLPHSVLAHKAEFITAVQNRNPVKAAVAAGELVNSPALTPQLVLPWDQQLAIHLPVVLPILLSFLTGGRHMIAQRRQERAAKKGKAASDPVDEKVKAE